MSWSDATSSSTDSTSSSQSIYSVSSIAAEAEEWVSTLTKLDLVRMKSAVSDHDQPPWSMHPSYAPSLRRSLTEMNSSCDSLCREFEFCWPLGCDSTSIKTRNRESWVYAPSSKIPQLPDMSPLDSSSSLLSSPSSRAKLVLPSNYPILRRQRRHSSLREESRSTNQCFSFSPSTMLQVETTSLIETNDQDETCTPTEDGNAAMHNEQCEHSPYNLMTPRTGSLDFGRDFGNKDARLLNPEKELQRNDSGFSQPS